MSNQPVPFGPKAKSWIKIGKAAAVRKFIKWMAFNPNIVPDNHAVDLFLFQLDVPAQGKEESK